MAHEPRPPGFEEMSRDEMGRIFGRLVGARLLLVPVALAIAGWMLVSDSAPWRRALLVTLPALLSIYFVIEERRYRRAGFGVRTVSENLVVTIVAQMVVTFATGGLSSPILFVAVVFSVMGGLLVPERVATATVAFQVLAVWAMAACEITGVLPSFMPGPFGGGPRGGDTVAHILCAALVVTAVLVISRVVGRIIRLTVESVIHRALVAREESLKAHAAGVEELTALSAEIAHELKNPLASVKGLAGLLAGTAEGKSAERLAVLRREADRMQGILDEFLNFSRPLGPLSLAGRIDLGALADEVLVLHEGMAHDRQVALVRGDGAPGPAAGAPAGGPVEIRCDPRKVKQVLINLLQNAIEASPAGAAVEVTTLLGEGGAALVRVRDRGRGLEGPIATASGERYFEAGVTTKAKGSGIGLTIARAIARQHGGEVTLSPLPGGGCLAELALPAEPPAARREVA